MTLQIKCSSCGVVLPHTEKVAGRFIQAKKDFKLQQEKRLASFMETPGVYHLRKKK